MTTRRDFLKQSAIIAAGSVLLPNSFNIIAGSKPRVVILGAGFAGLAAGYRLGQRNFDVTVLEARNRIGGRVFSYEIDKNEKLVIELGAEWVGASHTRIHEMCREFGLELENNQFDTHLIYSGHYYPKGNWDYSAEWRKTFQTILNEYSQFTEEDKKKLDKMDWWRFLMNRGITDRDVDVRELFDSTDFGESIRHVSAYAALAEYAESSEKNEMDYKIKGGNGRLAEKLAEKIGSERIKTKTKAVEVDQSGNEIIVKCSDSSVYKCDYVICAVPTFSLNKIKWNPSFPEEKIEALNALQYARINKHVVLFDERFWGDESFDMVTDLYGHYFYHATKNQKSNKGALISYTIGDKADVIHRQNQEFKKGVIVQSLKPAFGDISDKIQKQMTYYWGTDEYSKGAYALYGIGQWYTVMPTLKSRFKNVYFAGEHLADWQGFMEGAINTGEEAADEIIG
jgi:monoamine oxidase